MDNKINVNNDQRVNIRMIGILIACIRLEPNKIIISRYNLSVIKFSFEYYNYYNIII